MGSVIYNGRMVLDPSLDVLMEKVWAGSRIAPDEARRLYSLPLEVLGDLADRRRILMRQQAHGGEGAETVTYIIDRNINYTNICNVYCKFCAFWRTEKDADAYVIGLDELNRKVEETLALGGTQILMQGGHHPKLTKQWYLDLLTHLRSKYPQVNIHGFSPSEFIAFQEFFQEPAEDILRQFVQAGLGSLPGGGGEILVDSVRNRIAPLKANSADWMGVMDAAHRLGLASTATMMFGHVETLEDRIAHLEVVRAQQDKSLERLQATGLLEPPVPQSEEIDREDLGRPELPRNRVLDRPLHTSMARAVDYAAALESGRLNGGAFTAFIAWTFQPDNTVLRAEPVGGHEYLRMQALSRIYLDNIPSIQSSWVTQGPDIGQVALLYGANDFGSIMIEENVVSSAGTTFRLNTEEMRRLIRDLGWTPRQRDNWYRLIPEPDETWVSTAAKGGG